MPVDIFGIKLFLVQLPKSWAPHKNLDKAHFRKMLYPIGLQRDTSFATAFASDPWIYRIGVNPGVHMPVALEIVLLANPKSQTPVLTPASALEMRPRRALSPAQVKSYNNASK